MDISVAKMIKVTGVFLGPRGSKDDIEQANFEPIIDKLGTN